ncbi:MAG: DUF2267 domain-containing protein [Bacteroidales bacterium]|nr:DUF2267 domain-containing protein [Bacteroidales bacterium]
MEVLVKLVSEKAGISEAQAKMAIQMVTSFLKDKMPAGIGNQVESFIGGSSKAGSSNDMLGGITDSLGGMFGK